MSRRLYPVIDGKKECAKCHESKPVGEFFVDNSRYDKLTSKCKKCVKERESQPDRVEKRTKYLADYHVKNADKINTRTLKWQKDNPEKANAKNRRSVKKRHAKVLADAALYREDNREACRERSQKSKRKKPAHYAAKAKEWRGDNKDKLCDYAHQRRAREMSVPIIDEVELEVLFKRDKGICGICNKPIKRLEDASRDHIIPITKPGSEHSYRNMVIAHKGCNSSKGNRTITQQMRLF